MNVKRWTSAQGAVDRSEWCWSEIRLPGRKRSGVDRFRAGRFGPPRGFLGGACEWDRDGSANPARASHRPLPCGMSLPPMARLERLFLLGLGVGDIGEGPTWPWSERSEQGKSMGLGDWIFFSNFFGRASLALVGTFRQGKSMGPGDRSFFSILFLKAQLVGTFGQGKSMGLREGAFSFSILF